MIPVAHDLTSRRTRGVDDALEFSLVGYDRPGIERQVIAILSRFHIGIEALETQLSAEAYSGVALIQMEARIRLPAGLEPAEVQTLLENVSPEIIVDLP